MNRLKLLGIIRHVLTFAGGFLVAKGLVDENTVSQLSAAAVTLIGGIWSIAAPEKN